MNKIDKVGRIIQKFLDLIVLVLMAYCVILTSKISTDVNLLTITAYALCTLIMFTIFWDLIKNDKDYERIKIVYHADIEKIKRIPQGNWIDLRAAEDIKLKKGEMKLINLGVSMKLPEGYEAHLAPRSSTYKNFHIIQTNSVGIIDSTYSGTNDIWKFPALATEDTIIHKNDRICQFRIMPIQEEVHFIEVDELDNKERGGFGSTGKA